MRSLTGALALGAAVTITAAAPAAAHFHGAKGFAVDTAGQVHTFALGSPGAATARPITGLAAGNTVVGIDERPRTGQLYAVTKDAAGKGHAYTVEPTTGAAALAFDLQTAGTPVSLTGSAFGVDFNPAADALRITGDDGQNLRVIPSDTALSGAPRATAGTTIADGRLSYAPLGTMPRPDATGVTASAYTNSRPAPATTQLFDIDTRNADLVLQNPPNDGTLVKVADVSLDGPLQGFDVLSRTDGENLAFAALGNTRVVLPPRNVVEQLLQFLGLQKPRTQLRSRLVTLDLATGATATVGTFAGNGVVDIAVDTPAP